MFSSQKRDEELVSLNSASTNEIKGMNSVEYHARPSVSAGSSALRGLFQVTHCDGEETIDIAADKFKDIADIMSSNGSYDSSD